MLESPVRTFAELGQLEPVAYEAGNKVSNLRCHVCIISQLSHCASVFFSFLPSAEKKRPVVVRVGGVILSTAGHLALGAAAWHAYFMPEKAPQFIPYMPAGEHVIHATINGEPGSARVFVDASACARLNADLAELWEASRRREHARPVLYFDHKQGEAAAFPRRFVWEDERGILLEIAEWTAAGRAAVEGANYGYISPAFRLSREDGQVLGLVPGVEVGSLVNDPAFERIDPIVDNIAASKAAPLTPGVDIVTSAHCNQHKHAPGCNDTPSKGSHSADKSSEAVANVRKVAEGVRDKTQGAKNNAELREKMPDGKIGQIFSTKEEIIAPVSSRVAEAVQKETGRDVSGYSHAITEQSIWHAYSRHSQDSTSAEYAKQRDLQWDDFEKLPDIFENYDSLEVGKIKTKNGEMVLVYEKAYNDDLYTVVQRIGRQKRQGQSTLNFVTEWVSKMAGRRGPSPLYAPPKGSAPDKDIKAERASDVNPNEDFFSYILSVLDARDAELEEPPQKISTADSLACAGKCSDNGSAAKTGGNTTMTEEIKKKLGLPDDADDAAVEAAVTKLVTERDAHKKKAEDAEAACKKKDDELQAARASEKQAWLDDLKQRGVLAPKDEAAVEAAAALFEANPAAARTAYGKMQGVPAGAVITASQAVPPEEKSIEDLIQF